MDAKNVRGWFEEREAAERYLAEARCEWPLNETPCEDCGDATEGAACFFLSDGVYDCREGTYICEKCARYTLSISNEE